MVLQCATIIDHAGLTVGEYVANAQFVLLQDRTYQRHQCCQFKRNGDFGRSRFFWAAFRQTLLVLNKYGYANFEHNRDSLDSRAKCNRALREPDLHVFAKLFENCLKRSLEAKAFSGREIGGDDDVLDFLVGYFVDVDLTRQPAS